MRNRIRLRHLLAVALLGVLSLSACAKIRYPTNYVLTFPQPTPQMKLSQGALGMILVREFRSPGYLRRGRIVYRPSPEEVGFYEYHRWAMDPRQSVTQFMAETVRAQSLFNRVAVNETRIDAAYLLTGDLERLEEVDRGRDVFVECAISAELLDAHTRALLWSDRASETQPVRTRDMAGVVNALTVATRITVERLVQSMANELAPARFGSEKNRR